MTATDRARRPEWSLLLILAVLIAAGAAILARPSAAPSVVQAAAQAAWKVDVNTAGEAELQLLPGLGPRRATQILEWRRAHGPLKDIQDLRAATKLTASAAETLLPLIEFGPGPAQEGAPEK